MGETEHGYFAVSERAEGEFLDEVDNRRMKAVLPSLFSVMGTARFATLDVSNTEGYGNWGSDLKGLHKSWQEVLCTCLLRIDPDQGSMAGEQRLTHHRTEPGTLDAALTTLERLAEHMPAGRPPHSP